VAHMRDHVPHPTLAELLNPPKPVTKKQKE
jgi:hypothetical protein